MFGNENSIEPAAPVPPAAVHKPVWTGDAEEIPVREATRREIRRLRPQPAPHAGETDAVARRHNLYTADRWSTRIYYSDYQQKSEVMRSASKGITTKLDDRQTVSVMLDLAQARGWQTIKLRGSDSFKREAWVQAQVRGIATEGYQPQQTDLQEAERRKIAATPVAQPARAQAEASAAKPTKPEAKTVKPAPASTAKPAAADAVQTAKARRAAVWGAVEAAGQQARNDAATATPAQKAAEKPAVAATA